MKKSVIMMEIGTDDIENGMLLIGSHIDSPRLDIKQNPLYENGGMAYLGYPLLRRNQKNISG